MDNWDVIKQLTTNHGYSIKNALPLVHQTINKLHIHELDQNTAAEVITDILITNPILARIQSTL